LPNHSTTDETLILLIDTAAATFSCHCRHRFLLSMLLSLLLPLQLSLPLFLKKKDYFLPKCMFTHIK
jgi:hypothetical protein